LLFRIVLSVGLHHSVGRRLKLVVPECAFGWILMVFDVAKKKKNLSRGFRHQMAAFFPPQRSETEDDIEGWDGSMVENATKKLFQKKGGKFHWGGPTVIFQIWLFRGIVTLPPHWKPPIGLRAAHASEHPSQT
jgi:hypothetical protein